MFPKTLVGMVSLGVVGAAIAQADVSGTWMLNGPGTESEILLTEEGKRLQGDYDLLADDPSLYCTAGQFIENLGEPRRTYQD